MEVFRVLWRIIYDHFDEAVKMLFVITGDAWC